MSKQDRVSGLLLGLTAGDKNGGPMRMALRLVESLAKCESLQMEDLEERYLNWYSRTYLKVPRTSIR